MATNIHFFTHLNITERTKQKHAIMKLKQLCFILWSKYLHFSIGHVLKNSTHK